MAASSGIEMPVFIDTSLQTHIVISVSPNLTAAEFIRKFEMMHLNCFPGIGNIKVDGLMVKKKSHLYHLPASMPIKHVFQDSNKTWFLYTKISPKTESESHRRFSENICKIPTKKMDPTSERMSETVSVSGIIKKYFSVFDDEVTSSGSKARTPNYAPKTPPTINKVGGSQEKKRIGKRLIVAANNLGISTSDKKPVISLCKQKCDKFRVPKSSSSTVRHPVFEIGEE